MIKKAISLSFFGAFGACISGLLILIALVPAKYELSISSMALAQGLCFIPAGVFLGLSISYYGDISFLQGTKVFIITGIGGVLYGSFSTFPMAGSILGLLLLCCSVASSIGLINKSLKRGMTAVLAFLGTVVVFFFMLSNLDFGYGIVMPLFDPLRLIYVQKLSSIFWLAVTFYVLNLSILSTMPNGADLKIVPLPLNKNKYL
jgi:hypothetical protein